MNEINNFYNDKLIKSLYEKNKRLNKKVVHPEAEDIRIIKSLKYTEGFIKVLIGSEEKIISSIKEEYPNNSADILKWVQIIDSNNLHNEEFIDLMMEKRKGKITRDEAIKLVNQPNYYATLLLETNQVDALVGGNQYPTADILRPAFQLLKNPGEKLFVSSVFLLRREDQFLLFGDCAINIKPTADDLKNITLQTYDTAQKLGINPKISMLSYSTKGSGSGEDVDKVTSAFNQIISENPSLKDNIDGELQFDASISPRVADIKVKESSVAGSANCFIFPSLEAGNIGVKIAEYLGDLEALGPILQGFNKPVCDLSRGTTPETIAKLLLISLR